MMDQQQPSSRETAEGIAAKIAEAVRGRPANNRTLQAERRRNRSAILEEWEAKPYPIPSDNTFAPDDEDPVEFKLDYGLDRIANRLMTAVYPEKFRRLADVRIAYLWKRKGGKTRGKRLYGAVMPAPPVLAALAEERFDFILWLAADHGRELRWTGRQVEALLFHELKHLEHDVDAGRIRAVAHDFEGFYDELVEYGRDSPIAAEPLARIRQLPLLKDEITAGANAPALADTRAVDLLDELLRRVDGKLVEMPGGAVAGLRRARRVLVDLEENRPARLNCNFERSQVSIPATEAAASG